MGCPLAPRARKIVLPASKELIIKPLENTKKHTCLHAHEAGPRIVGGAVAKA